MYALMIMTLYTNNGSIKQIFFKLFAILIPLFCQTKEIFLNQDKPFILQCQKNNKSINASKLDLQILGYVNVFCLSGCELQSSVHACTALARLTSNFNCETGKYCEKRDQCNFVFNNASVELDGYHLACTDDGVQVMQWQIKGSKLKYETLNMKSFVFYGLSNTNKTISNII